MRNQVSLSASLGYSMGMVVSYFQYQSSALQYSIVKSLFHTAIAIIIHTVTVKLGRMYKLRDLGYMP